MSKKMFSRERERGKLRFSALLILIGLLLFGCDPTMVTITYKANGGEGEMKPQAVESGFEVKLNANTFTKDGSDFTGWNEAADGSGKAYADGATVTPTENLTLYAQWQVKSTPEDPGTEDPDPENPGTEDPDPPVAIDNHITNLVLIKAVEDAYRQSSGSEFGWTKTADGYVDMTNEGNKTLVEGVTSLGTNGDMFLNGIEYFTGLQNLILLNNSVLTKLPDLTSLSNLRILAVTTLESTADSDLTAVSSLTAVSGLPASLEELDLSGNKLTALDVSKLTNLEKLDLSENKLTTLDVSKLTNLEELDLSENKLTALDVSKLTKLKELMVFNNELTELDITNNTQLTVLSCFNNRMTALDITKVEAFSQDPRPSTSILACGLQRNDSGLQDLTLTATQAQKTALASLFSEVTKDENDPLNVFRVTNDGVVWNVPGAELSITAGIAVFEAGRGLILPFTVVNSGSLTEEALTQLLASATKTVTLFTADNETGTPVETGISHGVDGSTPYILVATAAFPQGETTYSKIEVVLEAEGYVTQTLTYTDVSVNVPGAELGITAGTAVFNKTDGLILSVEGQTIPDGADVLVSLGGTQVNSDHVSFNTNRTAIIVALAALTNDTVDMTVTVTVSADGYNDAVLPYEGVSTVWIPDNVTAALADSEAKIGGETVTVTVSQTDGSDSLDAVRILSGTYSNGTSAALAIGGDGRSFTAPVLESAAETGTTVTVTLVLGKENAAGSDTVTADNLSLTVYPSTHVRFNNNVFALVKGFDFKDSSALGEDVKYKEGNSGSEGEVPSENITDDGFTFTAVKSNGKNEVSLPTTDLGTADLTMFDLKWNDSENANVYVMQGEVGQNKDGWGFSVYKKAEQGTGSFLLGGNTTPWQPKTGALWSYTALADTFDQYFIYDNGSSAPVFGRGSTDKVYTVTNDLSNDEKFSAASPFKIFFEVTNDNASVEYTLRAVNFYKSLGSSN